jgi:hypothetical protein
MQSVHELAIHMIEESADRAIKALTRFKNSISVLAGGGNSNPLRV